MKKIIQLPVILVLLYSCNGIAAETGNSEAARSPQQYLDVSIDNIVIDTAGLVSASASLAQSIDGLALAIENLSLDAAALTDEEREALLGAVKSVERASDALSELATQIPQAAQDLTDRLPQAVRDARQPIADLSSGLQSARDGVYAITESLPQATENARELVNSSLDAALTRISIYTIILIAILALSLIGVMWFVYSQYLDPLAKKLDLLVGAPEQIENMTRYMKETSDNLLALQSKSNNRRFRRPRPGR